MGRRYRVRLNDPADLTASNNRVVLVRFPFAARLDDEREVVIARPVGLPTLPRFDQLLGLELEAEVVDDGNSHGRRAAQGQDREEPDVAAGMHGTSQEGINAESAPRMPRAAPPWL